MPARRALALVSAVALAACCAEAPPATVSSAALSSSVTSVAPASSASAAASSAHRPFVPERVASDPCDAIAVGERTVVWSIADRGHIRKPWSTRVVAMPKDGATPVELIGPTGPIGGFALDDERLYWTAHELGRVRATWIADGRWGGIAARYDRPTEIAIDEGDVFWVDTGPRAEGDHHRIGGSVVRASKRGGQETVIAGGLRDAALVAVDDASVYWTDAPEELAGIRRAPKAGGAAATLASAPQPRALAVDDAFVYWAEERGIRRVPKRGGEATWVAETPHVPARSLALDRGYVFFADERGGVHRVPKTGGVPVLVAGFARDYCGDGPKVAIDREALWVCAFRGVFRLPLADETPPPRVIAPLSGAKAEVVAFHPDGRRLIGADRGARWEAGGVRVYDSATGRVVRDVGPGRFVDTNGHIFAIDPERGRVYRRTVFNVVERRDLGEGAYVWSAETDRRHLPWDLSGSSIAGAAERLLLSYGRHGDADFLVVLDARNSARVAEIATGGIGPSVLLPDGHVALAASSAPPSDEERPIVRAWDVDRHEPLAPFRGPPQRVSALGVSRDGRRIITGSDEGRVTWWDVERRSLLGSLETGERVLAVALLRGGELAVVGAAREACVWDLSERKRMACSGDDGLGGGKALAVAPDESAVAWPVGDFFRIFSLGR